MRVIPIHIDEDRNVSFDVQTCQEKEHNYTVLECTYDLLFESYNKYIDLAWSTKKGTPPSLTLENSYTEKGRSSILVPVDGVCSFEIPQNICTGTLLFQFVFIKTTSNNIDIIFKSKVCSLKFDDSINAVEYIVTNSSDILNDHENRLQSLEYSVPLLSSELIDAQNSIGDHEQRITTLENNTSGFVVDANYVHTDNNLTNLLKQNYDAAYSWGNHANAGYLNDHSSLNPSNVSQNEIYRFVSDDLINAWNAKSNFSGSYNDLLNLPYIPTKVSDLTNDSGYLTSLSGALLVDGSVTGATTQRQAFNLGVTTKTGYNFEPLASPVAIGGYTLQAGSNLGVGQYYYFVTYLIGSTETSAGATLSVTTTTGNTNVLLTNIPVSADSRVTGRKLYRTKLGLTSDNEYYLATLNTTDTTYIDSIADASIPGSSNLQAYKVNTTSKQLTISNARAMFLDTNLTTLGINAGNTIISNNTSAIRTVLIGTNAGQNITTGQSNVVVGVTGVALTSGSFNTLVGDIAGYALIGGSNNTLIGNSAGRFILSSTNNTILGNNSGLYLNDGITTLTAPSYCVYIGSSVRAYATNESNAIVIGYGSLGLGSNTTVIGNTSTTKTVLFGNLGVRLTAPTAYLHIKAGTTTAGTAPLKLTVADAGLLTNPEAGVIEVNTTDIFYTPSTTRNILTQISGSTPLTTGYIPFATTSGYLTSDANLFWDNTNKYLGIGKTPACILDVFATKTDTSGFINSFNLATNVSPASASTASFYNTFNQIITTYGSAGNYESTKIHGLFNDAIHNTTGTLGAAFGLFNRILNNSTGTITNAISSDVVVQNTTTGIITNAIGQRISTPINATGTLTNTYGLYILSQTVGTQTNVPYAIYQVGTTDKNYFGGVVGIGVATPNAGAVLQIDSTTKAFVPPRMTTTQRNAISNPIEGMCIFNITTHAVNWYNGTSWV